MQSLYVGDLIVTDNFETFLIKNKKKSRPNSVFLFTVLTDLQILNLPADLNFLAHHFYSLVLTLYNFVSIHELIQEHWH